MIITNCDYIPGKKIKKTITLISESVVLTRNISEPFITNLKNSILSAIKMAPNIISGKEKIIPSMLEEENKVEEKKEEFEQDGLKELPEITKLLNTATELLKERMIEKAKEIKADAIINVRFITSMIMFHEFHIIGYGTAVKISN
ncbi:MAG TPA: heavy metal-binding domain-containing protein [bacterium]|nr:heavy metal-binding domain-containing protein [bacterium]HOL48078.1 heavy metal-binding domain-containing protein [bacterium]HPQ19162.1 heavy metal-binding domain-containing protein [bacterium]